jgi:hypothetical protein
MHRGSIDRKTFFLGKEKLYTFLLNKVNGTVMFLLLYILNLNL